MSAIFPRPPLHGAAAASGLHFGHIFEPNALEPSSVEPNALEPKASEPEGRSVQWSLKRNCSLEPRQMLVFVGSIGALSLAIGCFFWMQGLPLVLPFAGLEVVALVLAFLFYARHATDREWIQLRADSLVVEHAFGRQVNRVEFAPAWVRVEPEHGDRSLVELSGQGRRISVGRFVRPEARRQLAEELRWALRRWQGLARHAPTLAPQPLRPEPSET